MRNKPNYELKAKVLNQFSDLLLQYRKSSMYDYAKWAFESYGVISKSLEKEQISVCDLDKHCMELGIPDIAKECKRINNAYYHRSKRLSDRIERMLKNGHCLFVTLTFTDQALQDTQPHFRRIAVRRYLKNEGIDYVSNIDFGSKNHREHYHAVVLINNNLNLKAWRYGAINVEHIKIKKACETKLAKYVAKLTNHAVKETTKRSVYIYRRMTDTLYLDRVDVVGLRDITPLLFFAMFCMYFNIKINIVMRD